MAAPDLALDGVGEFPAGALKIERDLALGLTLARRHHGVEQPAQ